jgi:hypothetical protein
MITYAQPPIVLFQSEAEARTYPNESHTSDKSSYQLRVCSRGRCGNSAKRGSKDVYEMVDRRRLN